MRMKIIETITKTQKTQLILNNKPCGIFDKLFLENEPLYSLRSPLSTQFYLNRSGQKTVSVIYPSVFEFAETYEPFPQRMILVEALPTKNIDEYALYVISTEVLSFLTRDGETFRTSLNNDFMVANEEGQVLYYRYLDGMWVRYTGDTTLIPKLTNEQIYELVNNTISTQILRPKYLDKWNRIYKTLIEEQYNALYNEEYEETKSGSRKDKTTYDTEVENDGNVGTHESRTYSNDRADDIYGFNSVTPVGDSTSEETSTETTVGDASLNTSHNTQSKTGTDTKDNSYEEKITRKGRNGNAPELLQMELDFRNKQTLMSIILKDVDEETTLKIYL